MSDDAELLVGQRSQRLSNLSSVSRKEENRKKLQSKQKILFVIILFILSLISFILQTEFTAVVYKNGFAEPFFLLYLTHSSWWIMWVFQVLIVANYKTLLKYLRFQKTNSNTQSSSVWISYGYHFKKSLIKQHRNIYSTLQYIAESNIPSYRSTSIPKTFTTFAFSIPLKYIYKTTFMLMLILTVAGSSWYFAMSLSIASDVTAIYNCSAFAAYAFAIPILGEKFSLVKCASVVVAIVGVFIVSYSGSSSSNDDTSTHPYRFWGNSIIFVGAILYGLYEVLYKKFACISNGIVQVSSKKQASLANFTASLIGLINFVVLGFVMVAVELSGLHRFDIYNISKGNWLLIVGSVLSNICFSCSFLALMSLTSPVLSSVASLVTIFLIGLVEWIVFDIELSWSQVIGDFIIIVGFSVLTYASWNEVEDDIDDDESVFSAFSDISNINSTPAR